MRDRLLWFLLLTALAVRLPLLTGSFWLDEAAQALEVIRPWWKQLDIAFDFQPPLLHLWLHGWQYLGKSEWWLRWWGALLPGLVTIGVSYHWLKNIASRRVALWAGLLLATSSFHVFYSQELRPYALPAMWAAISWWILHCWWRSEADASPPKQSIGNDKPGYHQLGYAVITALGLFSSYLYAFVIPAQIIASWVVAVRTWRKQLIAAALALVSFVPWLPMLLRQLAASGVVRDSLPAWERVVSISQTKSLALIGAKFTFGVIDVKPSLFFVVTSLTLLILVGWIQFWQRRQTVTELISNLVTKLRRPNHRFKLSLQDSSWLVLLVAVVVPIALAWIFSFAIPIVRPKRLLFVMPAFYALLSWPLIQTSKSSTTSLIRSAVPILLLVLNVAGLSQYWTKPELQRENWRQLQTIVTDRYPVDDTVVVFSFPDPFAPWQWYDRDRYQTVSTGQLNINDVDNLPNTLKPIAEFEYVITFEYLADLTDPDRRLLTEIEEFGYQEVEVIDQPLIGFTRVFARPERLISEQ